MKQQSGEHRGPLLILHAGAGPRGRARAGTEGAVHSLTQIARRALGRLGRGEDAVRVAGFCCHEMESDPQFNAGFGSGLQADGVARLSAAVMDGHKQRFSGVVGAAYLSHPSQLAEALQKRRARVLASPGIELLARQLNQPVASNLGTRPIKAWLKALESRSDDAFGESLSASARSGTDTVGCVLRDAKDRLVAAASTGGRGGEFPGRVSDVCTVAGTYASRFAAIAATGIGEQIVDDALASRLETRVRDGVTLRQASERAFREAVKRKHAYGWIALDRVGWSIAHTTPWMPFVVIGRVGGRLRLLASAFGTTQAG